MAQNKLRERLYTIIFKSDTPGGKAFDISLLIVILVSVTLVILESIAEFHQKYGYELRIAEWIITIIFTVEYVMRIIIVKNSWKYIFSFYGIVDLLSVVPTYFSLVFAGAQGLMVIRTLRLLRVFRILKLTRYTSESLIIQKALKASRVKISVFLFAVMMVVIIVGTLMYLVEGPENGFVSIPISIYWTIVTLTTVGYGDLTPLTGLGKVISSFVMILGYGIIAVPTGIVTAEFSRSRRESKIDQRICEYCSISNHEEDAKYCRNCGEKL